MLKNYLENSELSGYHPTIDNYLTSANITIQKGNAEKWLIARLKNDNVKLKQLMLPLDLTLDTSVEETDGIERLRLAINLSSEPAQATTFTLQGSDDNTTFETITTLVFTVLQKGIKSVTFNRPYQYYKLTCSHSVTPLESYLVETTFDLVLANATLGYIANSLRKSPGDIWAELNERFITDAIDAFSTLVFPKDADEDGEYGTNDELTNTKSTELFT